jgi:hypothetical protein
VAPPARPATVVDQFGVTRTSEDPPEPGQVPVEINGRTVWVDPDDPIVTMEGSQVGPSDIAGELNPFDPDSAVRNPSEAVEAVTEIAGDQLRSFTDFVGDIPESIAKIAAAIIEAGKWVADPDNWLRVIQVAAGTVMVIGGLVVIAKPIVGNAVGSTVAPVVNKALRGQRQ